MGLDLSNPFIFHTWITLGFFNCDQCDMVFEPLMSIENGNVDEAVISFWELPKSAGWVLVPAEHGFFTCLCPFCGLARQSKQ